jgi:endonuclease YncB( thermonuclease family)
MALKTFWTPNGITLDTIRQKRLVDISDGDTPNIRMSVRMLSIDTPEKKPTGRIRNKDELQDMFGEVADWMETGDSPVNQPLATHLLPRLRRPDSVAAHLEQGAEATLAHEGLIDTRLRRATGSVRPLFVRVADQRFDSYGRLLAYVAPSYTANERRSMSRKERATFNFLMIENGWAAPFVLFPSIPGERDLPMMQEAAKEAVTAGKGAWADDRMLTGYEFRMCERLAGLRKKLNSGLKPRSGDWTGWVSRYCFDMSTLDLFAPQDYCLVEPYNRIFIWRDDVRRAVAELNLTPSDALVSL